LPPHPSAPFSRFRLFSFSGFRLFSFSGFRLFSFFGAGRAFAALILCLSPLLNGAARAQGGVSNEARAQAFFDRIRNTASPAVGPLDSDQAMAVNWASQYVDMTGYDLGKLPFLMGFAQREMYLESPSYIGDNETFGDLYQWVFPNITNKGWTLCGFSSDFMVRVLGLFHIPAREIALWNSMTDAHTTVEFWSVTFKKWVYYDPLYGFIFLNEDGVPAGTDDIQSELSRHGTDPVTWTYQPIRTFRPFSLTPVTAQDPEYDAYHAVSATELARVFRVYAVEFEEASPWNGYLWHELPYIIRGKWNVRDNMSLFNTSDAARATFWPQFHAAYDVGAGQGGARFLTIHRSQPAANPLPNPAFGAAIDLAPVSTATSARADLFFDQVRQDASPGLGALTPDQSAWLNWIGRYVDASGANTGTLPFLAAFAQRKMFLQSQLSNRDANAPLYDLVSGNPTTAYWGNSSSAADFLVQVLAKLQVPARLVSTWNVMASGETLVEMWSPGFQKWACYDPYYGVFMVNAWGVPASVTDLQQEISKYGFNPGVWTYQPVQVFAPFSTQPQNALDPRYAASTVPGAYFTILLNYFNAIAVRYEDTTPWGQTLPGESYARGRWLVYDYMGLSRLSQSQQQQFWADFDDAFNAEKGSRYYLSYQRYNLPDNVPSAPFTLKATAAAIHQVTLNWGFCFGADSYRVKRSINPGGPYALIASGVTAHSYTDNAASGGVAYYYVVSGVNANGESLNSPEASATATDSRIIDDADAGFTTTGAWTLYPTGYQSGLHYAPPGAGDKTAKWSFTNLAPGRYRVAVTWPYSSIYASNAPFTVQWPISTGQTLSQSITVNQASTPSDFFLNGAAWKQLGNYDVYGSSLDVQLSNAANGMTVADAARIDRVADLPAGAQAEASVEGSSTAAGAPGGTLAFGNAFAGAPLQKRIWVKSVGTAPVQLSAPITLPAGYSLVSGFGQTTLQPGEQTSFTAQLDAQAAGNYGGTLSFGANDPDFGGSTFTVALQGTLVSAQTIDDGDAGFTTTGAWTLYPTGYQSDLRYAQPGDGSALAKWSFSGLGPGRYRVLVTWPFSSAYASSAPFTVRWPSSNGKTLSATLPVNQASTPTDVQINGAGWAQLGGSYMVYGSTLDVQVTNAAGAVVVADAVRVERLGDLSSSDQAITSKIVDDGDSGFTMTGAWTGYGAGYQSDLHYAPPGAGDKTAKWSFTNLAPGRYRVAVTWPFSSTYASNAPFTVAYLSSGGQALTDSVSVNQASTPSDFVADGAGWSQLGGSYMVYGSTLDVQVTNAADRTVIADGVRVDRIGDLSSGGQTVTSEVIDDGDASFAVTGAWSVYGVGYRSDLRYAQPGAGDKTAKWSFTNLAPGRYRVSATWPYSSAYASNAPLSIRYLSSGGQTLTDSTTLNEASTPKDFTVDGVGWKQVGDICNVYGSTLDVQMTNAADKVVVADGMRADWVGPLP
jgi:uncharacterized protein (DUF2141 family)